MPQGPTFHLMTIQNPLHGWDGLIPVLHLKLHAEREGSVKDLPGCVHIEIELSLVECVKQRLIDHFLQLIVRNVSRCVRRSLWLLDGFRSAA